MVGPIGSNWSSRGDAGADISRWSALLLSTEEVGRVVTNLCKLVAGRIRIIATVLVALTAFPALTACTSSASHRAPSASACRGIRISRQTAISSVRKSRANGVAKTIESVQAKVVRWSVYGSAAYGLHPGMTNPPPSGSGLSNSSLLWVVAVHGDLTGPNSGPASGGGLITNPQPGTGWHWATLALDAQTAAQEGLGTEGANEPAYFVHLADLSLGGC